jgi:hypothetical protein
LERTNVLLAQADVVGEVHRALSVLGQGRVDSLTLARLLVLNRLPQREEALAKRVEALSPRVAHALPRLSSVPRGHGSEPLHRSGSSGSSGYIAAGVNIFLRPDQDVVGTSVEPTLEAYPADLPRCRRSIFFDARRSAPGQSLPSTEPQYTQGQITLARALDRI